VALSFVFVWIWLSTSGSAGPVTGQLTIDVGLEPESIGESKVDGFFVDIESTALVTLSVSGLDLTNLSVFSLMGLEFEAFTVSANLPITLRDTILFAPNVLEVADDLLWTVTFADPDPGGLVGLPLRFFIHELASPLDLSKLLGATLEAPLVFRKNILESELAFSGVVLRLSLLMANLGSAGLPDIKTGFVFAMLGQTPGGMTVESATYLGARQGFQCYGECKEVERFWQGRVMPDFRIEQEKLFIRRLTLAGIIHNVEIVFDLGAAAIPIAPGISKFDWELIGGLFDGLVELRQRFLFSSELSPAQALIHSELRIQTTRLAVDLIDDDTAILDFPIRQVTFATVLGGVRLKDVVLFQPAGGLLHAIVLESAGEVFDFSSQTIFLGGLVTNFYSQRMDALYHMGQIDLKTSVLVRRDFLLFFGLGLVWRF
jgi:hypothetical protein